MVIQLDEEAVKLRTMLKILMYGQGVICNFKYFQYGSLTAFFQTIVILIIYTAYKTMHFCNVMIFLILCILDLNIAVGNWINYEKEISEDNSKGPSKVIRSVFIVEIVYFIVAIYYSFFAYCHFKTLFETQLGNFRNGANRRFEQRDRDEEIDSQPQRDQIYMRENFLRQQQQQLRNVAAAQRGLNN
ncbi:UNKNOWN [Stylonychia lemnae]|uniref:Uncharacterized protein n=1 Tax=Stylonychia lemnae TaxID=5949 RepID=A0A078AS70_STYLE|nr:UNKNOWN [Stylonychia lemnae]|eukprot:CDW84811.1 UNKNOWN [Stylonychia lemnae]